MDNDRIGPYRIENTLGSGGMGVVYLAWDERLRRRVAIKSIHPGKELSDERRERLLREARAAAGLSHPAIAQVFDILLENGRDYIVMEYVEGRSLTSLLGDRTIDIEQAVDIGRQIAEGLAAAHQHGIVHRDLKSENIIISPGGQVKILDFGLAKSLDPEEGEVSLTEDGVVMGTSRAMSPEQARGGSIDHRSDLFSLGSLLYEMATGQHPFQGSSPLDTMQRVVRHRPPPAEQVNSQVPEELSFLIENLLEKDPDNRPSSALEVALALRELSGLWATTTTGHASLSRLTMAARRRRALRQRWLLVAIVVPVIAAAVAFGWWRLSRPGPPRIVAVLEPQSTSAGDTEDAALLATAARTAATNALLGLRGLALPAPQEVDGAGTDPRTVARQVAASEVITTELERRGATIQVTLQRLRGSDGVVLWSSTFSVPADDLSLLSDAIAAHLLQAYPHLKRRRTGRAQPPSPQALAQYVRLYREQQAPPPGVTLDQILDALDHLRQSNPRFLLPYLTAAETARYLYLINTEPSYLDRAHDLLRQAHELAPEDPRVAVSEGEVALDAGDLKGAERATTRLERLDPGSPDALRLRANLLRRQGHTEQALELFHQLVTAYPSVNNLRDLAEAELHSGKVADARRQLQRALSIAPRNRRARGKLAQLELLNGDPAEAERLYGSLAREYDSSVAYSNLGLARLLQGKVETALKAYKTALELAPKEPISMMSVGDCQLLLGQEAEAKQSYRRALELAEPIRQSDPASYWSARAQCLAHLGEAREAVMAVQEELRALPDEPGSYFDAALVYTILGDRTTAVVDADKAVKMGFNPRWFELPFFKPLRDDPDFRSLLESTSSGRAKD
ncbi:MAG: protein kinase [Acidobacteria bacterium]|nr:protein kinase [Acidobacteriota bacterium]